MSRRENRWENIWDEGFESQRKGRGRHDNPHPEGTHHRDIWDCGWADAAYGISSPSWD